MVEADGNGRVTLARRVLLAGRAAHDHVRHPLAQAGRGAREPEAEASKPTGGADQPKALWQGRSFISEEKKTAVECESPACSMPSSS